MKRRTLILLAAVGLAAGAALYFQHSTRNEPAYEGKSASEWVAQLANPKSDVLDRDRAATALARLDTNTVPALIEALEKQDSFYTSHHARLIKWLPDLVVKRLPPPEPTLELRRTAAESLGNLGSSAQAAIPALCRALSDPDRVVRGYAYTTLNQMGAKPIDIIHGLIGALHESDETIRVFAAGELGLFLPESKVAIPDLIDALNDERAPVRLNAIHTLGMMGSSAKDASPKLTTLLRDPRVEVRYNTAITLWQIDQSRAPDVVPVLMEILKSNDDTLVLASIRLLGDIGPAAKAAVPALEKFAANPEANVRRMATDALTHIDSGAAPGDKSG